jgi:hypothetical protein
MNAVSTPERAAHDAGLLVLTAAGHPSAHSEFLSICERLAAVWAERARSESELWCRLKLELAGTADVAEALRVYSEIAGQRLRMALENAQRIFEEEQTMVARFSHPLD